MDKQKIKSVPRLTTDNPVDNFQTALNFTDVSEDGWVWLRQPEMALTEYARQLVKGHGSSIDLGCNDMELSESLTDHLFDDPKQSIDGLIAEHYTILWAYATLREKLKWYEDAGIPVIPNYGLSAIRRAINRYGTAPQLQMAIKEMSELFEHDLLYLFRLADDLNELRQHDVNIRDFFPDALVGDLDLRTVAVVEGYGPLEIADRLREL